MSALVPMKGTPIVASDEDYLKALLGQRENRRLEFKEARTSYSYDKFLEYVAGIGNAGGGVMLFGVSDSGDVVGSLAFRNPQELEHKVHVKIGVRIITREITSGEKRVLVVQIPGRQRGVPLDLDGRYLLRTGESLVSMTAHQLREIFNEGNQEPAVRPVKENLTGTEVAQLLDIEAHFQLLGISPPGHNDEKLRSLAGAHLLVIEADDSYSITAAGALFLARDLNDFPTLAWRRVRLLKYSGNNRLNSIVDHFETTGYGIGFERIMDLINSHVPTREYIGGGRRVERPLYHPTAIREFLANALVHQDLDVEGVQITIEIFDDRIEIKNPGRPLIDVRRFVDEARTRNRELSDVMRLARLCEARGSGIDRALTDIEGDAMPAPEFHAENDVTTVVLFGERSFDVMTMPERVWATFLHACVKHVASQALTNSSLRARFGLKAEKTTLASATITATMDQGLIRLDPRVGASRKHARYMPFFA